MFPVKLLKTLFLQMANGDKRLVFTCYITYICDLVVSLVVQLYCDSYCQPKSSIDKPSFIACKRACEKVE